MESGKPKGGAAEGAKGGVVCPICEATFRDVRGLNGHIAGRHGAKIGLTSTIEAFRAELEGAFLHAGEMCHFRRRHTVICHGPAIRPSSFPTAKPRCQYPLLLRRCRHTL